MKAWILAGGLSRRFGSDKALFAVDGEPLARRTARVLRECGLEAVLVARHSRPVGLPELLEPEGPRHPLHGVATVLALDAAVPAALFVPCDLVDLDVAAVRAIFDGHRSLGPVYAEGQPLLCVLPPSLAALAARHAAAGSSVRAFLREAGAHAVVLRPLRNLNTPG